MIDGWCISFEIAIIWISLDSTDDQSTLVQVMAWYVPWLPVRQQAITRANDDQIPVTTFGVTNPQLYILKAIEAS